VDNLPLPGLSRRALIRNGLLVGLGAIAAVAALPELSGTALAENSDTSIIIYYNGTWTALPITCQPDWWYCVNCYGMYHSDNDTAGGVCPKDGGPHQNDTSYSNYCIPFGGENLPAEIDQGLQAGWRWCNNCQGIFWGNAIAESYCPNGGHHVFGSATVYGFIFGSPPIAWENDTGSSFFAQYGWLYCGQCRGLFYGHGTTSGGWCPAGGHHSQASGSYNYDMIPYVLPGDQ
jgi:hypothetical protein